MSGNCILAPGTGRSRSVKTVLAAAPIARRSSSNGRSVKPQLGDLYPGLRSDDVNGRRTFGSSRLHAGTSGCGRACSTVGGKDFRVFDRLDKAALVGDPLARDVESRAMVDGRADDGQTQGDVHARKVLPLARLGIDLEP